MGKLTIKRTLAILLVVLFVASVTAASVSAQPVAKAKGTIGSYTVKFSSAGTTGDAPLTYDWDFDDGTPNSAAKNPTHVYASGFRTHNVVLKVEDTNGDSDTATLLV